MSIIGNVWKPSTKECQQIREAARKEVGLKRVTVEVGERVNIKVQGVENNINIARVTRLADLDDWSDTDLWSPVEWSEFTKGVELSDDGRAIIDFYVREPNTKDDIGELLSNIVVYFADGKIQAIKGV
jgi:hypothetical protein